MSDLPFGFGPSDPDDESRRSGSGRVRAAPVPGVPAAPWASACPAWAAPAVAPAARRLRHGPARADAHAARADAQPVVRAGRRAAPSTTSSPRRWRTSSSAPRAAPPTSRAAARGRGVGASRRAVARGRDDAARRAPRTVARLVARAVGGHDDAHLAAPVRPGGAARRGRLGRGPARGGPPDGRADARDDLPGRRHGLRLAARRRARPARQGGAHLLRRRPAARPGGHRGAPAGRDRHASPRASTARPARCSSSSPPARPRTSACSGTCRGCASACSPPSRSSPTASPSTPRAWRSSPATSTRSNPESLQQLMSSGMFEPQTTESQKVALRRLETLLALVEGWVDVVVADAVGERLPGAARAAARRCAAAAPPAGRPSRPSPPSSGSSCGRAGCATPPRCGGRSPTSAASRAATRSGRTPTSCPPPTTSTTRPPSSAARRPSRCRRRREGPRRASPTSTTRWRASRPR